VIFSNQIFVSDSYVDGAGYGQKPIPSSNEWMLFSGDGDQVADLSGYDINGTDKSAWFLKNGCVLKDIYGADRVLWSYNNGTFSTVIP